MTVTPRFQPDRALDTQFAEDPLPAMVFVQTTDEQQTGSEPKINLTVNIDAGSELKLLKSLNHSMMIQQPSQGQYELSLKDHHPDKDFALVWQYADHPMPKVINFSEEFEGDHYGLLLVIPPQFEQKTQFDSPASRQLVLIIDTSGSMAGNSIVQARSAALYALQTLKSTDTLQIIEFDNNARKLFAAPVLATPQNKSTAQRWISRLKANGGTNIAAAFDLVFAGSKDESHSGELQQVVFLTDGAVSNEAELFRHIENNLGNRRLFTVGLGSAPNRYFMKRAANIGRGSYQIINDPNNLAAEMRRLFNKLSHPVLSNIDFQSTDPEVDIAYSPDPIPELYAGEPLILSYRLASDDSRGKEHRRVDGVLKGWLKGREWLQTIEDLKSPQSNDQLSPRADNSLSALATMWARKQIADKHQRLMLYNDLSQKQEITDLALKFSLVSPFTSFVAVEKQRSRPQGIDASNKRLANTLPSGQRLPNTALNWQWRLYLGLLVAIVAVLMLMACRMRSVESC